MAKPLETVARAKVRPRPLGGLAADSAPVGPAFELNPEAVAAPDWMTLEGDGTLRRLSLDVGQVNAAFAALGDPRATARASATRTRPAPRSTR